jgi:hypothetical protein
VALYRNKKGYVSGEHCLLITISASQNSRTTSLIDLLIVSLRKAVQHLLCGRIWLDTAVDSFSYNGGRLMSTKSALSPWVPIGSALPTSSEQFF